MARTMLISTTARIAGGPNPGEPWEVDEEYGRRLIAQGKATDLADLAARVRHSHGTGTPMTEADPDEEIAGDGAGTPEPLIIDDQPDGGHRLTDALADPHQDYLNQRNADNGEGDD